MTLEEMQQTVEGMNVGECPSAALHEVDSTGMVAIDDVTVQEFDLQ